ncbi:MFS transporter [Martelella alba]|uniref:MFS transporter n=1 Tax=Martelella alba TaxID=2590451 RepID=A0ABY2SQZ2_9HYPH|nr:MFS transporter [Martelella alba]TKI08524.1 MFS transporter [Martelella alba]
MKATKQRFFILSLIFIVTAINYMDRANLAVAGGSIQQDLALDSAQLGLLFSMFTWTYAACQIPAGYLLDKFGVRMLYGSAIFIWSLFTVTLGIASHKIFNTTSAAFLLLIICRALIGAAEAPSFLANTKIISSWFPDHERGRATTVYFSAQYLGLAFLTPVLSFLVANYGWGMSFYISGAIGIIFGIYWLMAYRDPQHAEKANQAELELIRVGGGYGSESHANKTPEIKWGDILFFLKKKTVWGLFITQFACSSTLYFFLTWFIVYLEKGLHLTISKAGIWAMLPFIMAMAGALLSGFISDMLLKKGKSQTFSRKFPVVLGLIATMSIGLVNYFEQSPAIAIAILSFAFFANTFSNLGWVVWTDVIPHDYIGTTGGMLNLCGNLSGIVSPIVIGVLLQRTQNFHAAIDYIVLVALLGALSYLLLVGKIEKIGLPENNNTLNSVDNSKPFPKVQ